MPEEVALKEKGPQPLRKVAVDWHNVIQIWSRQDGDYVPDSHVRALWGLQAECVNDNMRFMPRIVTTEELVDYWPDCITAKKFATLQEALSHCLQAGRCAFVVRISTVDLEYRAPDALQRSLHICVNLSFAQARDILSGTAMHEATALLAGACSCEQVMCCYQFRPWPYFPQNSG